MLSTRNRYRSWDARLLLWRDPYFLQLFAPDMNVQAEAQQGSSSLPYQAEYRRLRVEAQPPLGDRSLDFDMPRHGGEALLGDDSVERD